MNYQTLDLDRLSSLGLVVDIETKKYRKSAE